MTEDAFGEDEGTQAILGEGVQIVLEPGVVVWVRLLENAGVRSLAVEDDLVGSCGVPDQDTHALPGGKWQHIHQFKHDLLLLYPQLNEIFRLFDETVPNRICEVDEADLIWATSLKLVLLLVLNNVVAYCHAQPELIKVRFSSKPLQIVF